MPWLTAVEADSTNGLAKPSSLEEAKALSEKVHKFESQCADNLKVLEAANGAAIKMTTHKVMSINNVKGNYKLYARKKKFHKH